MSSINQSERAVGPADTEYIVVNETTGEAVISLPEAVNMLNAGFARAGADLMITAADGTQIVLAGYFDTAPPPDLVTQDGLTMAPDLVEALMDTGAPGRYASLDTAIEPLAIGTVQDLIGNVTVTRADGTQNALEIGAPIFEGDLIDVGAAGAVTIRFVDDSTFSLDENSQMVIDEMIFDPSTLEGQSVISLINGVFVFVSGEIAINNPGDMLVKTPVSVLGVRASLEVGVDAQEGHAQTVVVLASNDPPDASGALLLQSLSGSAPLALSSTYDAAVIADAYSAPARSIVTPAEVDALFGKLSFSGLRIFDDAAGRLNELPSDADQPSLDKQVPDKTSEHSAEPSSVQQNSARAEIVVSKEVIAEISDEQSLEELLNDIISAAENENLAAGGTAQFSADQAPSVLPAEKSSPDQVAVPAEAPPDDYQDSAGGYSSVSAADTGSAAVAGEVQPAEAL